MVAIASERSRALFCVAGKAVSSEDGDNLQVEIVNIESNRNKGRTLECLHAQSKEMTTPTG